MAVWWWVRWGGVQYADYGLPCCAIAGRGRYVVVRHGCIVYEKFSLNLKGWKCLHKQVASRMLDRRRSGRSKGQSCTHILVFQRSSHTHNAEVAVRYFSSTHSLPNR